MSVPVFEEYEPAGDCVCPGCAQQRRERARALPVRAGGHPAAHGARRALVLVTAAGAVLSGGGTGALADSAAGRAPVPEPEAAVPRAAPSAARPGGTAAHAAEADEAAPAPRAVRERAAGTHPARAGRARPEQARAAATARSRGERAGRDRAPTGPGGAHPARVGPLRADGREPGPDPETPQGGQEPLHGGPIAGPAGTAGLRKMARADIMNRAKRWVNAKVPYSMSMYWADGYRQDCSGYVSMAWHLPGNEWTGSLAQFGTRIERKDLQPGDILLFHNPSNPSKGSHVTLFGGWGDSARTKYIAYEQARPNTRRQTTPLAYWSNSDQYVAYRYKALKGVAAAGGQLAEDAGTAWDGGILFPGAGVFGPGEDNAYVARLGRLLGQYGFGNHATPGPGSRWGEAHRQATQAFQRAQGWTGPEADGMPGPDTWRLLVNGTGRKAVPGAVTAPSDGPRQAAGAPAPAAGTTAAGSGQAPPAAPSASVQAPGGTGSAPVASVPAGSRQAPAASVPAAGTAPAGRGPVPGGAGSAPVASVPAGSRQAPVASVPAAGTAPAGRAVAAPARPGPAAGPAGRGSVVRSVPGGPRRAAPAGTASAPGFPGHGHFRPGSSGSHVDMLRRQLVQRGFGRHYSARPGPRWGDADRRSVEAFQRAQGWHGAAADGYPGPETWRRLFS
ncbi:peptidoglycan-binding protein [Streptomyces sp. NPDC087659]|uniref:peptidoglycan-binding protein n=1 Tax=Streptomyces sp. NPDC087659 TaxID=3365801 RepID=UPI0038019E2F